MKIKRDGIFAMDRGLRAHRRNHLLSRPAVNGAGLITLTTGVFLTHESK
jgi:hypothetical protein